jgi:hypothetical protein
LDAAAEAASVEQALRELGTPERAVSAKAYLKSGLDAADIGLLEDLLRSAGTWALVDGLAANVTGRCWKRRSSSSARRSAGARDKRPLAP